MVAALFFTMQVTAQTQFATLVHEGTFSSFTGADALSEAMAAAADGDVITLSSGTFNGCTISKAITLRGAGMEADEQGRQTIIQTKNMGISVNDGEEKSVNIEGIYMPSITLSVNKNLGSIYLNKCAIGTFMSKSKADIMVEQAVITNCKINELSNQYQSSIYSNQKYSEISLYNTYVINTNAANSSFYNCAIGNSSDGLFYNCIFLKDAATKANTTDHCVIPVALEGGTHTNNYVVEDVTTLFNNYDAEAIWYTRDLTLTDEAKATYLGSDGTEVGLYGGSLPFSPWLDRPIIKRLTVAPRSSKNGKLSVDIEVSETE